mgnify:CR=1 FL=1
MPFHPTKIQKKSQTTKYYWKKWKSESKSKSEKVKVKKWMVNEVNGERGEFDEYDVCSEWQKGQKVKSDFT